MNVVGQGECVARGQPCWVGAPETLIWMSTLSGWVWDQRSLSLVASCGVLTLSTHASAWWASAVRVWLILLDCSGPIRCAESRRELRSAALLLSSWTRFSPMAKGRLVICWVVTRCR